eukprot:m.37369 g.37369  ORF g.37369 m.37369 type:complete len:96 (-) comp11374_c0_seq5:1178-1465(-)
MLNNLPSSTALFAVVCMSFLLMFYQSLLRTQDGRSSKDEFKVSWAQPSASSPDTKRKFYLLLDYYTRIRPSSSSIYTHYHACASMLAEADDAVHP